MTYCCQHCIILQSFRYCTNTSGVNVIATLEKQEASGIQHVEILCNVI